MFDVKKFITGTAAKGKIVGFDQHGTILVETETTNGIVSCYCLRTSTAPLPAFSINDIVAYAPSEDGSEGYILGLIEPYITCTETEEHTDGNDAEEYLTFDRETESLTLRGKTIRLNATEETVVVCGKSTIHLKQDGRVVVRGTKLLSRSSGPNKIKGASVAIN